MNASWAELGRKQLNVVFLSSCLNIREFWNERVGIHVVRIRNYALGALMFNGLSASFCLGAHNILSWSII